MGYKGQTARLEFDDRDNIFVGHILGISDVIGFHADTVQALRAGGKSVQMPCAISAAMPMLSPNVGGDTAAGFWGVSTPLYTPLYAPRYVLNFANDE